MILEKKGHYRSLIETWCVNVQKPSFNYETEYQKFLEKLYKKSGIHISYDQECFLEIKQMFQEPQYCRFSRATQPFKLEKGYTLFKICHFLGSKKFIKSKHLTHLIEVVRKQALQIKLEQLLGKSKEIYERFKVQYEETKSMNGIQRMQDAIRIVWNQQMNIELIPFWNGFVKERKLLDNEIVKGLYHIYSQLLKGSVQRQDLMVLQRRMRALTIEQDDLDEYINQMVKNNDLQEDRVSMEAIYQQVDQVKSLISSRIREFGALHFEQYGSLRSGFALRFRSDADITIFTERMMNDKQVVDTLFRIKYIVEKDLPYQKSYIIKQSTAKVKSVTLRWNQFKVNSRKVDKIDIVINNYHGVNNSRLLSQFSKNVHARRLVLLMKLWAKGRKLIEASKFSSYGIVLMTIFYMIKRGQIDLIGEQMLNCDKKDFKLPKVTFNQDKIPCLIHNLIGIFQFYSKQGPFFTQNMVVRLSRHAQCINQEHILINMIDPLDHSNPGRFKSISSALFFGAVQAALSTLKQGRPSEVSELFLPKKNA